MHSETHAVPSSWPPFPHPREIDHANDTPVLEIHSWPCSQDNDSLERSGDLRSFFERAAEKRAAENASRRKNEDLFFTLAGILPRRRLFNDSHPWCNWLCCGPTSLHALVVCYVICFILALATWTAVHAWISLPYWLKYGTKALNAGGVLYWVSFFLPGVDSLLNLGFTTYQLHNPYREDVQMHVIDDGGLVSWNPGHTRPWWFRLISLGAFSLLVARAASLLFLCTSSICSVSPWLQAAASLLETLPLLASCLAMYGHINIMIATLDELRGYIIQRKLTPERCLREYRRFQNFVRVRSTRWQILVVMSTFMEVYVMFFQTLFLFMKENVAGDGTIISVNVVLLGFCIAPKLLPLALFNYKVKRFPHDLVIAAQRSEDATPNEDPQQLASFRIVVRTIALLFHTEPPCLQVLRFVIDHTTLAKLAWAVALTSTSRYLIDLVDSN